MEMRTKVFRSTTVVFADATEIADVALGVTTYADTGRLENTQYWYWVRHYLTDGATTYLGDSYGPLTATTSGTLEILTRTISQEPNGSGKSLLSVSVTVSSGANSVYVESKLSGGSYTFVETLETPSTGVTYGPTTGLSTNHGVTRFFRLTPYSGSGATGTAGTPIEASQVSADQEA